MMSITQGSPDYIAVGERFIIQIPLTDTLSKNAQYRLARGRMYLTADAQAARDAIAWNLKARLQGRSFRPGRKVWLDLWVQRSTMRSDPINVLDAVADAVKNIIGIDDRWFAVARLDWMLVRHQPPVVRLILWQEGEDPDEFPAPAHHRKNQRRKNQRK